MNTPECFQKTLQNYQSNNSDYYSKERINALKYNQGDFDFQFWHEQMGEYGRIIESFENIAGLMDYTDTNETFAEACRGVISFEAGILKSGFHALTLRAVQCLISGDAFEKLNRTDDFIAYASTGNDYIDYSITMRKTIDEKLFYRIFPDIEESDNRFREVMMQTQDLSAGEFIDFWLGEAAKSPFDYNKCEMDVFVELGRYGRGLAQECLVRLKDLTEIELMERNDYENLYFYSEALHFSGGLSSEQKEVCRQIASQLEGKSDVLKETAFELIALSNS